MLKGTAQCNEGRTIWLSRGLLEDLKKKNPAAAKRRKYINAWSIYIYCAACGLKNIFLGGQWKKNLANQKSSNLLLKSQMVRPLKIFQSSRVRGLRFSKGKMRRFAVCITLYNRPHSFIEYVCFTIIWLTLYGAIIKKIPSWEDFWYTSLEKAFIDREYLFYVDVKYCNIHDFYWPSYFSFCKWSWRGEFDVKSRFHFLLQLFNFDLEVYLKELKRYRDICTGLKICALRDVCLS